MDNSESGRPPYRWWALYIKHRPGIERYPGSYLRPIMNRAEDGDADMIALLKHYTIWDELQHLIQPHDEPIP